jgi:hypothetical protein
MGTMYNDVSARGLIFKGHEFEISIQRKSSGNANATETRAAIHIGIGTRLKCEKPAKINVKLISF